MKTFVLAAAAVSLTMSTLVYASNPDPVADRSVKEQYEKTSRDACRGQWRAWFSDWLGEKGNPNGHEIYERVGGRNDGRDLEDAAEWFAAHC